MAVGGLLIVLVCVALVYTVCVPLLTGERKHLTYGLIALGLLAGACALTGLL